MAPPPLQVLSCLVQIASVRRSLFNNAERAKFLSHLVDGVKRILANPQVSSWSPARLLHVSCTSPPLVCVVRLLCGAEEHVVFQCLPDPNNYHEFCRLLARLKSNYQLGELVKVENYPEVIRLIANFTVTSLQVRGVRFQMFVHQQLYKYSFLIWCRNILENLCFVSSSALGVRSQQRPLPVESLAAPGGVGPVRQSHRASPAGDVHAGGHQGLHHLAAGVGPRHPPVTDHTASCPRTSSTHQSVCVCKQ